MATTYNWTGGASDGGKWTTPGNWGVGSGYPGSSGTTDVAQFTNGGTFSVKLTSAISIASLNETSGTTLLTLNTAGFNLTIGTGIILGSNSSTLTFLGSGAISFPAISFQNGDFLSCGSSSDATTKISITGALIFLAANSGNGIFNYGTLNLTTSQLYTGSTSQIYNATGATFNCTTSSIYMNGSSSSVVNNGAFNLIASSLYLNVNPCSVTNNPGATLSMNASLISFSTNNNQLFYNYGTVNALTGSNSISMLNGSADNTLYNYGTFNAGSGTSACTITVAGTRGDIKNTTTSLSGTTYNGTFNLGSISIIKFDAACNNCQVSNDASCASCSFNLLSDVNGAASIYQIPSGSSCPGTFNVERFVTGGSTKVGGRWVYRNYRLMSSPVNLGVDGGGNYPYSLNYLGASTIITDCVSTYATKTGNPSLYLFNENYTPSNKTFISGNFIGVTNISNTSAGGHITTTDASNSPAKIYTGDGFMIYFRGDNVNNISGSPSKTSAPYVAPENVVFTATGNLNQGAYSVVSWTGYSGMLYTTTNAGNSAVRGFNLVGNPYPCSIDWSTFSNSISSAAIYGPSVNPTIYILNPVTNNYDTYTQGTNAVTGSGSKVIPSGQGFFVQSNNHSSSLTFQETAKTTTLVTGSNLLLGTPLSQNGYDSFLRLKLITDSIDYDDMVVGFNSNSTTAYNANVDAAYLPGLNVIEAITGISSDHVKTSVKWLPLPKNSENEVFKLYVSANASGQYTIKRTDLQAIPSLYEVWLRDKYKKDSLDIRNNDTYLFNINLNDTTSFGENRFELVIRENPLLAVHLLNFTAIKGTAGSQLAWKTENEQNYTNFTVQRSTDGGNSYLTLSGISSDASGSYGFLDKNPVNGTNSYRLKIEDLDGNIIYSSVINLFYGSAASNVASSNISIYPNPTSGIINMSVLTTNSSNPGTNGSLLQNLGATPSLLNSAQSDSLFYDVTLINILGGVIKTTSASSSTWQDNVANLPPGSYIIQVVNSYDKSLVGRGTFIKL